MFAFHWYELGIELAFRHDVGEMLYDMCLRRNGIRCYYINVRLSNGIRHSY
jgi:hypothetical protein